MKKMMRIPCTRPVIAIPLLVPTLSALLSPIPLKIAEARKPKAMLAREFGISRDTLNKYLKLGLLNQKI
jgi:hypothetical protein